MMGGFIAKIHHYWRTRARNLTNRTQTGASSPRVCGMGHARYELRAKRHREHDRVLSMPFSRGASALVLDGDVNRAKALSGFLFNVADTTGHRARGSTNTEAKNEEAGSRAAPEIVESLLSL